MVQKRPYPLLLPFIRVGEIQDVRAEENDVVDCVLAKAGELVQLFTVDKCHVPLLQPEGLQVGFAQVGAFSHQDNLYVRVPVTLHEEMAGVYGSGADGKVNGHERVFSGSVGYGFF